MSSLNSLPVVLLNRPYFDLGLINISPLHVSGVEFSYRNLVADVPGTERLRLINPVTIVHPVSFRESLIRETGLFQYQVDNPLQLVQELRTDRWNTLCNYLTNYQELQPVIKLRVINLLCSLCFHQAVLEYVPEMSETEIASSSTLANIAFCRAMSNVMLQSHSGRLENLKEFEKIANHAPLSSPARFNAAMKLITSYAKSFRNLKAAEYWLPVATEAFDNLKPSLDDFSYKRLTSVYYRAVVFIPLLKQDKETVIQEMDLCESLAEQLISECKGEVQEIAANENLETVLESRSKEALWLKDIDLAEARARRLIQLEPLYSRYRLQLGEILIKQGKIEEAAKMYRSAARLGPPGTAIAWFMAGQCHEKLGELDIACDCYLASVQMDSLAISAVERLNHLAPSLGNSALLNWSNTRLSELRDQQKIIANQPRISYMPEASSELKTAAEALMV
jgi:tetratricopeptide (TPR) repeat protein